MSRLWQSVRCLGLRWALFRLLYAAKQRTGWLERAMPMADWPSAGGVELRVPVLRGDGSDRAVADAERMLAGEFPFFSHRRIDVGFPPDWFYNPFALTSQGADEENARPRHWSRVNDAGADDIKGVWELSRFGSVYTLARAYRASGRETFAQAFWELVEDWQRHNPPNAGVHWRCGQEVAIRVMAWTFGAGAFADAEASTDERRAALGAMIAASAERIRGNIAYALSQDNNHAISEAMGLWTAGNVLPAHPDAEQWVSLGGEILRQSAERLIYDDGTFSQYSLNYHRLMLHDYLWAFQVGTWAGKTLGEEVLEKVRRAGIFLQAMVDPATGRVPNIGANDGAHLLPLTDCDYTDFRPTLQAVALMTSGRKVLPDGPWDELAQWLGLEGKHVCCSVADREDDQDRAGMPRALSAARPAPEAPCAEFADGGFAVLRGNATRGILRSTRAFRHRPSHADLMHLDLWCGGTNVLRDGGSYSYNCDKRWLTYFRGTASHNTVQFDWRDQMPSAGRFLFADWIRVEKQSLDVSDDGANRRWSGQYTDCRGATHRRDVTVEAPSDTWTIVDHVSGYAESAVLRWRLCPEWHWYLDGAVCRSDACSIIVTTEAQACELVLAEGWESHYYGKKSPLPVLEIKTGPPSAVFTSVIAFESLA